MLVVFNDQTRIELNIIGCVVEMFQSLGYLSIGRDVFEGLVRLEVEVFSELIECRTFPGSSLPDTENLNRPHHLWHLLRAHGVGTILNAAC
jgi:hypothetical protein